MSEQQSIRERLTAAMGGKDRFRSGWSWRSHVPEKRAEQALDDACAAYHDGLASLSMHNATEDQAKVWIERFVQKWVAYMQAGARTANPMITGPARFPVEKNRKAMETERKRGEEFWHHANNAEAFMRRQHRSQERAIKSAEAAQIEHKEQAFGDVRVIYNQTLERIQLVFPGKPSDAERATLKDNAFRWSPREGAWQRKLTNNGVHAARRVLEEIGAISDK